MGPGDGPDPLIPPFVHEGLPQRLVFGPGRAAELAGELERLDRRRPLVLCSWRRQRFSEDFRRTVAGLAGRLEVGEFAGVEAHVPREGVEAAWAAVGEHRADAVVSYGGGSAIDLGKALVFLATWGPGSLDGRATEDPSTGGLAHVAVPTTYSGSEATTRFGVTDRAREEKRGFGGPETLPAAVVADPALTLELPPKATGSTGMNALAHCVEALYSRTRTVVTDAVASHAAALLARWLPVAVEHPHHLEARNELLAASYLAGTVLNQAGMGLHHGICHGLGGRLGVPHGVANAVMLPHVMRFNLEATREGQEALARAMGAPGAEAAADAVEEMVKQLALPTRLRETGVLESDLQPVAAWCAEESPAVRANPKPAGRESIVEVLRAAW